MYIFQSFVNEELTWNEAKKKTKELFVKPIKNLVELIGFINKYSKVGNNNNKVNKILK